MSAKPKRSEVVLQCAHAACECWSASSGRPVSQKIFYRVLASLESSLPAHFAGRRAAKTDDLVQLEISQSQYFQPETVPMTEDKEEAGVPVQMYQLPEPPEHYNDTNTAPPEVDEANNNVLGVPVFNPKPLSEDYWG